MSEIAFSQWLNRSRTANRSRSSTEEQAVEAKLLPDGLVPVAVGLGLLLVLYASWLVFRWTPSVDARLVGGVFLYPVSGAATVLAWHASRRISGWPQLRWAWRLLALGGFAYLLGDVAQTVYELLGRSPYPSVTDGLYLSFYPLALAGLLLFPTAPRTRGERVRLRLDLAVVGLAETGAITYFVLGPNAILASENRLPSVFSIAYPVGDIVLGFGVAAVLLRGTAPSARAALRLLAAGLASYLLADLAYGYITLHSTYQGGDPIDALWMIAISLSALAAVAQRPVSRSEPIVAPRERSPWLPFAATTFGFSGLLYSERHDPVFPGTVMLIIAVAMAALVVVRQLLSQRDLVAAQGELRYEALHDALTGLPNRVLVLDRAAQMLARARRQHSQAAALFLDVDGFKDVNDTYGHATGDRLLRTVAARLTGAVREADTVGRLGGDEFVVLLDGPGPWVDPELVAERLLAVLRQPIELDSADERALTVTASIGIAAGLRESPDELLRDADLALYAAKEAGEDRAARFQSVMQTAAEERLSLGLDLRAAIDQDQFTLVYQPIFDLQTNALYGVEALIRWQHPSRGQLAPDQFIPLAEHNGLILQIGAWVLHEACAQAATWHKSGYPIDIAVNVSGRQLDCPHFLTNVQKALATSSLPASALTLEITETALMCDTCHADAVLSAARDLGVRIAIDDFGTGYSSLAHLRQLPADTLKIDRSFISGAATSHESRALLHTLIELGKTLGLQTVGEGIETTQQLQQLQQLGCDHGQGFLLAHPLNPNAINHLLTATQQPHATQHKPPTANPATSYPGPPGPTHSTQALHCANDPAPD